MVQISPTIKKIKISEKYIVVCPYVTQRRFFILRPAYSFRMSNGYSMDIFVGDSGNIPKKTFTSATSGYYGGYPVGYSLEYYLAIRGIFLCSLGLTIPYRYCWKLFPLSLVTCLMSGKVKLAISQILE